MDQKYQKLIDKVRETSDSKEKLTLALEQELAHTPPAPSESTQKASEISPTSSTLSPTQANSIPFHHFCRLLVEIRSAPKLLQKLDCIAQFLQKYQLLKQTKNSPYPFFRLLLPKTDRRVYNLKASKLAQTLIRVLGLTKQNSSSRLLLEYENPQLMPPGIRSGDFAGIVHYVMKTRAKLDQSNITLGQVNDLLDQLSSRASPESTKDAIRSWSQRLSAQDHEWMVRLILKDLKIHIGHERILQAYHPDAKTMFSQTNDLEKVLTSLRNPEVRHVHAIEPFQSFTPMLACGVNFATCIKELDCEEFVIEPKLDGERILCHVTDDQIQFISRNTKDYTDLYLPWFQDVLRTQLWPGIQCVLDGEMMVWSKIDCMFEKFGTLKTVAKDPTNITKCLCYVVWDVVYLGGPALCDVLDAQYIHSSVMALPLRLRRMALEKILTPLPHQLELISQEKAPSHFTTPEEYHQFVMEQVDKHLAAGYEGLVLKDLTSHYAFGEAGRRTKRWIKLKPDYAGLTDDYDVLILGGYYGRGLRRGGTVSQFLLGVINAIPKGDALSNPIDKTQFYTLTRVGTGYNRDELRQLNEELQPHWRPWDKHHIPAHFGNWVPTGADIPNVWIDPKDSQLLEIMGFELISNKKYSSGLSVRFPRCRSIRRDKNWYECMTLSELHKWNAKKGPKRRASDIPMSQGSQKRRRKHLAAVGSQSQGISKEFQSADLSQVVKESQIFRGLEFCVLPSSNYSKHELEKQIVKHGGEIVQNPRPKTNFCIAQSIQNTRVRNLVHQNIYDIVSVAWIEKCMMQQRQVALTPRDFVSTNATTKTRLEREYDEYGDPYYRDTTIPELEHLFADMNKYLKLTDDQFNWQSIAQDLSSSDHLILESDSLCLLHCVIYIDEPEAQSLLVQEARCAGARVVLEFDSTVTHVILTTDKTRQRIQTLISGIRAAGHSEPNVVSREWLLMCLRKRLREHPQRYRIFL